MSDNQLNNSEILLPYGDTLRPLVQASNMTDSDLKKFLAKRGVYINSLDRNISIPLLTTCILSPFEFQQLREKQRTKEDDVKIKTREIPCKTDLELNSIVQAGSIKVEELNLGQYCKYKPKGNFTFFPTNQNQAELKFEIERTDYTKDWANIKSSHEGKIIMTEDKKNSKLVFSMEHTSSETEDFCDKIVKCMYAKLKDKNLIEKNSNIEKITCGNFSNENRFKYMLSFTDSTNLEFMTFKSISTVELIPDPDTSLPSNIQWMANKVKNLLLSGNELHKSPYILQQEYHKCLILYEINAYYDFNYHGAQGTCYITFGFPQSFKKYSDSSEFEIKVTKIYLPPKYSNVSKSNVTKFIQGKFLEIKIKKNQQFKLTLAN